MRVSLLLGSVSQLPLTHSQLNCQSVLGGKFLKKIIFELPLTRTPTQLPICTQSQVFRSIAAEIQNTAMEYFDCMKWISRWVSISCFLPSRTQMYLSRQKGVSLLDSWHYVAIALYVQRAQHGEPWKYFPSKATRIKAAWASVGSATIHIHWDSSSLTPVLPLHALIGNIHSLGCRFS